jgi:hypothetical protein
MAPLFSIAGPDDKMRLMNSYHNCIFPEDKFNDALYLKKVKSTMERLRNVELIIKPI